MAVVRNRDGGPTSAGAVFGFAGSRAGLGAIVTPGQTTYPSDDGTFTLVRGTGEHYGNALIGPYLVAGTYANDTYALDDNDTGASLAPNQAPVYHVGGELQRFLDDTPNSREFHDYEKSLELSEEAANPYLKAYHDALRQYAAASGYTGPVDDAGVPTQIAIETAPKYVQDAYTAFTGNPVAPPPAPYVPGPAEYLIAGIDFLEDGTVKTFNGKPVTGITLTPDEIHSLLTAGSLPAGDQLGALLQASTSAPITTTATAPAPSSTTAPAATTAPSSTAPAPSGDVYTAAPQVYLPATTPAEDFAAQNGSTSGTAGQMISPPATAHDITAAAGGGVTVSPGMSTATKVLLGVGAVAALGFLVTRSRPSRRR